MSIQCLGWRNGNTLHLELIARAWTILDRDSKAWSIRACRECSRYCMQGAALKIWIDTFTTCLIGSVDERLTVDGEIERAATELGLESCCEFVCCARASCQDLRYINARTIAAGIVEVQTGIALLIEAVPLWRVTAIVVDDRDNSIVCASLREVAIFERRTSRACHHRGLGYRGCDGIRLGDGFRVDGRCGR